MVVEKVLISSEHKMKKSSCIIQNLRYTPPCFNYATIITHYLLRAINKGYTRFNNHPEI